MDHSQDHRSLWQELDALVLAEVEALNTPRPQPQPAPESAPPSTEAAALPADAEVDPSPRNLEMFDGEEQEVIARTSAWLRDRPNRDMIIDALWSAAAGPRANDADADPVADETGQPATEDA